MRAPRRAAALPLLLLLPALLLAAAASPAAAEREVVFEYRDAKAQAVGVAGSFNDWDPAATPMRRDGDRFRARVLLPDGYHRYKFVVDGTWIEDPLAEEWDPGPKGTNNCMVRVGPHEKVTRDFRAHPAVLDLPPAARIVAMSDLHGTLGRFWDQLTGAGVAGGRPEDPRWTGGETLLVLCGDYLDRGDESKEVLDLVMALERLAPESGGRVVALMGNHEHMRIVGAQAFPDSAKSFERAGLRFDEAIGPDGVYGKWIRDRPLACRVNRVLFCHGGLDAKSCGTDPQCRALDPKVFAKRAEAAIAKGRWGCAELGRRTSLLWARHWWDDEVGVRRALKAWDCEVCVFGHTPEAIGEKGVIGEKGKRLVRVDVGINPLYDYSKGAWLEIAPEADEFAFVAHPVDGEAKTLFRRKLLQGRALRELTHRGETRGRERKAE